MNPTIPYPLDYEITIARIISLRLKALRTQAEELERALARLHRTDFGTCEGCGEPIPFDELEANPALRRCMACAKEKGDR